MWTLDVASTRSRNTSVATNQDQQFPMWTPDFAGIHSRNTSVAANQNQAFPMQTLDFASTRSRKLELKLLAAFTGMLGIRQLDAGRTASLLDTIKHTDWLESWFPQVDAVRCIKKPRDA